MSNRPSSKRRSKPGPTGLHPENRHQGRYDFGMLTDAHPGLSEFTIESPRGDLTIDFSDSVSVKALNEALLKHHYQLDFWSIPDDFLCPPIPGRADYIHYLHDLVGSKSSVRGIDIGTGANLIYPILGQQLFGWSFVASDINPQALNCAQTIIDKNNILNDIVLRHQSDSTSIFSNIIKPGEYFDFTMCNPPFHTGEQEAREGTNRKLRNLSGKKATLRPMLNFGGQAAELWCPGGEVAFIRNMIRESRQYQTQVGWFTTLVAKREHLAAIYAELSSIGVAQQKTIKMAQGSKQSRFVAWRFKR